MCLRCFGHLLNLTRHMTHTLILYPYINVWTHWHLFWKWKSRIQRIHALTYVHWHLYIWYAYTRTLKRLVMLAHTFLYLCTSPWRMIYLICVHLKSRTKRGTQYLQVKYRRTKVLVWSATKSSRREVHMIWHRFVCHAFLIYRLKSLICNISAFVPRRERMRNIVTNAKQWVFNIDG